MFPPATIVQEDEPGGNQDTTNIYGMIEAVLNKTKLPIDHKIAKLVRLLQHVQSPSLGKDVQEENSEGRSPAPPPVTRQM